MGEGMIWVHGWSTQMPAISHQKSEFQGRMKQMFELVFWQEEYKIKTLIALKKKKKKPANALMQFPCSSLTLADLLQLTVTFD